MNKVNYKWDKKMKQGYYENPFYEYVKSRAPEIIKSGNRNRNIIIALIAQELWKYGQELGWNNDRIEHNLDKYGMTCLSYWLRIFNIK